MFCVIGQNAAVEATTEAQTLPPLDTGTSAGEPRVAAVAAARARRRQR